LLLCASFGYRRGELFLLDHENVPPPCAALAGGGAAGASVDLLARLHMEDGDETSLLRLLRREGRRDPDLCATVLQYFVNQAGTRTEPTMDTYAAGSNEATGTETDRWRAVGDVLEMVERDALLPPAQVVTILASNPALPLHVAAGFVAHATRGLQGDVDALRGKVQALQRTVYDVSTQQAAAAAIPPPQGPPAAVPPALSSVSRDMDEDEDPAATARAAARRQEALADRRKWEGIRAAQLQAGADQEGFYAELEHATDGFATIASYFGKVSI